ncbi:hypothetical protein MIR68_002644 [Amoeboaphelidium protococcarum]|nr:hypothetical protein MIR68_002644 [Amoeboaphelidium protococcarum]
MTTSKRQTPSKKRTSPRKDAGVSSRKVPRKNTDVDIQDSADYKVSEKELQAAKSHLCSILTGRKYPATSINLQDQIEELERMCDNLVLNRQSSSALLYGPKGTGKSMMVNSLVQRLKRSRDVVVVQLQGSIHSDDRLVVQQISLSMGLNEQQQAQIFDKVSFHESYVRLFEYIRATKEGPPLIFTLDEFDKFTQHSKQSLLYNLFDTVQSSGRPILVIGITVRLDVMELLEKRVKSRFSHRQIYCWPASSFESYLNIVSANLQLSGCVDLSAQSRQTLQSSLDGFLTSEQFLKIAKKLFQLNADVRLLFKCILTAVNLLNTEKLMLDIDLVEQSFDLLTVDSRQRLLEDLSQLELCMIVAMKRLLVQKLDRFNFEMVYREFTEFTNIHHIHACKKMVAYRAFENFLGLQLIVLDESYSKNPREFKMVKLAVDPTQIKAALQDNENIPHDVKRWAHEM